MSSSPRDRVVASAPLLVRTKAPRAYPALTGLLRTQPRSPLCQVLTDSQNPEMGPGVAPLEFVGVLALANVSGNGV
jgi:hypothetical protein